MIKHHIEYFCRGASQWTKLQADLPYQLGVQYCQALGENLCLSMPGKIIVYNPKTCLIVDVQTTPNQECLKIATVGDVVYTLNYSVNDSGKGIMVLRVKCWRMGSDKWETLLELPRPDLKVNCMFAMPNFPCIR